MMLKIKYVYISSNIDGFIFSKNKLKIFVRNNFINLKLKYKD